jgi:hypothetical protein
VDFLKTHSIKVGELYLAKRKWNSMWNAYEKKCPKCYGSRRVVEHVVWQGQIVVACRQCDGKGIVPDYEYTRQVRSLAKNHAEHDHKEIKNAGIHLILHEQGKVKTYKGGKLAYWRHGKGKAVHKNGMEYDGNWSFGKWSGQGALTWPNAWIHEGHFKSGMLHGKGTLTLNNGIKFEGKFYRSQPRGKGVITFEEGSHFEGRWSSVGPASGKFKPAKGPALTAKIENGLVYVKKSMLSKWKEAARFSFRGILAEGRV